MSMRVFMTTSDPSFQEQKIELSKLFAIATYDWVTVKPPKFKFSEFYNSEHILSLIPEFISPSSDILFSEEITNLFSIMISMTDVFIFFPSEREIIFLNKFLNFLEEKKLAFPIVLAYFGVSDILKISKENLGKCYISSDIESIFEHVQNFNKFSYLLQVAKCGDVIDYPVPYSNVALPNSEISSYCGWRVLKVYAKKVFIVTAGTPVTFRFDKNMESIDQMNKLRSSFFWDINSIQFEKCGFAFDKFSDLFNNKYTLEVSALSADDFSFLAETDFNFQSFGAKQHSLLFNGTSNYLYHWRNMLYLLKSDGHFSPHQYGEYGLRFKVALRQDVIAKSIFNGVWQLG